MTDTPALLPVKVAEIERFKRSFEASANAMRMDGVLSENDRLRAENAELRGKQLEKIQQQNAQIEADYDETEKLRAENAELRELVKAIAAVPLWRDTYHDGPDVIIGGREAGYFNPDQVRKARAILAQGARTVTEYQGKCTRCGNPFVGRTPCRLYCNSCQEEVHREKEKERSKQRYSKKKEGRGSYGLR